VQLIKGIGAEMSVDVTVLMAVFNGAKYVREAVDSILQQTVPQFEFLICRRR
jgi:glycosyltransferase involved in cell wall biosynthesis